MKKLLVFFLFFLFAFSNGFSQSGWYWFNPLPSNKTIRDLQYVNQNTGFAFIDHKIFKTTNEGSNWYIPGDTIGWWYFKFLNESTGVTISTNMLYKTSNCGLSWIPFSSYYVPSSNSYTGFDLISLSTIFFTFTISNEFGTFGHIGCTTNGGTNWFNPIYPEPQNFFGIKILSQNNAYALAQDSGNIYIYKSFAPTSSWFRLSTGLSNNVTPSFFVKDSVTVFISGSATIITTDGGYNWQNLGLPSMKDIKFMNSLTGIATGSNHQIFRTTNGGLNWNQINSPVNYNFNAISFINQQTGYLSGELGSVLKSTNSGQSWIANCSYFTLKNLNDFVFLGKDTLIMAADSGYIFKTTNQGLNWSNIITTNKTRFKRLFFLDKITGFAIADSGYFYKTTNSGVNWQNIETGYHDYFMHDVFFLNQYTGFVSTGRPMFESGNIYRTTNGGSNWTVLNRPEDGRFFFVRFLNENTGFISCWENIYKTTNLGNSWIKMNTDANSNYHSDLCFINEYTGFTSGGDGYIHKTTDGGNNWFRTAKLVYSDAYRVNFINQQTGYATAGSSSSGLFSGIFSTTNSGESWQRMYIPLGTNADGLTAVKFYDSKTGFVIGEKGIMFKTTTGGFVGIKQSNSIYSKTFLLNQNYPNPFNPSTIIRFSIPKNGFPIRAFGDDKVVLKVYNILGKEIATLVNEKLSAGTYEVKFDGTNLPSGVYYYRIETESYSEAKKMLLIK